MASEGVHQDEELLLQAARDVADALGEATWKPRKAIRRITRAKGVAFAREHLEQAQRLHAHGGVPRKDGRGLRTLGGVFFELVQQTLGNREFYRIAYTVKQRDMIVAAAKKAKAAKRESSEAGGEELTRHDSTQRPEGARPAVGGSSGAGAEPQV